MAPIPRIPKPRGLAQLRRLLLPPEAEVAIRTHWGAYALRAAVFSPCRRYRYLLVRSTRMHVGVRPDCVFVMLNPSTADEFRDDPTVARCFERAKRWGKRQVWIMNLFAFRATDPADLKRGDDPIGEWNNAALEAAAKALRPGGLLVCGWGTHGSWLSRSFAVREHLEASAVPAMRLGAATKGGEPRHPLYVSYATELETHQWPS